MKSATLLTLGILLTFVSIGQSPQCVTLRGKSGTGQYRQWLISSYNQTASDTTGPEIVAAGWTCNAQGYPTCNFRSLIWYNLSQVPANATIVSARLYLYAHKSAVNGNVGMPTYGSSNSAVLQRVSNAWGPSVGWGNIPAAYTTSQKVLAQSTSTAQDYEIDVKDFVQQWVSEPASNHGMLLKLQNEINYNSLVFHSGKSAESLQPRLEICYTTPPPPVNCANAVIIRGDRLSGRFKQLHLTTMNNTQGDTSQPEMTAAAWTCNANGFPTCNFRSLFRYDVSQVPAGATITSATLYLYAHKNAKNGYAGQPTYGDNNAALLQRVINNWTLTNTGWGNQPAVTTAGQRVLPQSTGTAQNYTVDLKDLVQYWVNQPDSNYGVLLRLASEQAYNSMIFYSGQGADSVQPRLEICYTSTAPARCGISFRDSVVTNSWTHQFIATPDAGNNRRPVRLCWSFGDGKDTCINYNPASPFNYYGVSHTYKQAATYQVRLIAEFEGSCVDTTILQVTVKAPTTPPACDKQLVIKGSPGAQFRQLLLSSYAPFAADTTQPEIVSAAWTCNAIGESICNFRSLLRYDLRALPANAIITGAKLYLYAKANNINGYSGSPTFGSNNTSLLQRVIAPWQAAGTGWSNQPAVTSTAQKVLSQSSEPRQHYVIDMKDFVQYWVNKPDSNYGVLLRLQSEGYYNSMVFNSGQATDSLRPRLEICYTVPNTGTDSCRANFTDSIVGSNSLNRNFTAATWNSRNKRPIRICWSFGDGKDTCINYPAAGNLPWYGTGHQYQTAGTYNVCVTIQYDGGCSASYCRKITVLGAPAPQPCTTTILLKGDRASGRFKQLHISTMAPYAADTTQPEITAAAWTCYGIGYSTCDFRAIMRYDVSMVPANAIINSAKLTLYANANAKNGYIGNPTYGENNTALLQRVTAPWAMAGTGWANQPATTADKQKVLAQSSSPRQNYVVDVTDFVQGWVKTPASNNGMLLRLQTEQYYNSMVFHSGSSPDSVRPRLEICYTLPDADTNKVEMKLYPNPSFGQLQAWILANKDETGDAKLYDMQGNLKKTITNQIRCRAGINLVPIQINRGGVPTGNYYVKIRVGTTTKTFKIFLL
ncbi:DNRLRE domain-containing protein [Paraflavitalea sp. CAU 1676]|uniref:DNRLRE domain-containing protein n=1 Tax=Paraflavitalea sp. CAU 1676 TaxID=3032598 RepID=UPI0023DC6EF2|nr:DNRLRE domain-containing protein [Paraflavitalea sp. CAU 1676]MDF2188758.1 DNRLRE domain-containing protein [Paraflavitalea sp. CAU 1676]